MLIPHTFVDIYSRLTAASVAGLWQGAMLAVCAAAILRLTQRASASLRHRVLFAVFAIAFLLPWVHFEAFGNHSGTSSALRIAPGFAIAVATAWMLASLFRAVALVTAWRRLRAVRNQAIPIEIAGIDGFDAGTRRARLCVSAGVDSPTIVGFREPRLLLPTWMKPLLSEDDLRQIALHECEHLRRYDDWSNVLLQVALVLCPLNPALIWLERRIAMQRELACDAAVVASTARPIAYATCLTRLAEQRMYQNRLSLALAAWGRQSELGQRIDSLLAQPSRWTAHQSRIAATATAAVLFAGTVVLARTPFAVQVVAAPAASNIATTAAPQPAISSDANPYGMKTVQAAFYFNPPAPAHRTPTVKRHGLPSKKAVARKRNEQVLPAQQAFFLRTSATDWHRTVRHEADVETDFDHAAIRFVTTEFSSPYVAVPTANGWLVFQL